MSAPYSFRMIVNAVYWASVSDKSVLALHSRADHLVRPPLMSHLARDYVVNHIDVVGLVHASDEADAF